jgi:hypothetical protein
MKIKSTQYTTFISVQELFQLVDHTSSSINIWRL